MQGVCSLVEYFMGMPKKTIRLLSLIHRGKKRIGFEDDLHSTVIADLRSYPGIKWSKTKRGYYVDYSKMELGKLFDHLREKGYYVDYSSLKKGNHGGSKKSGRPKRLTLNRHQQLMHEQYVRYLKGLRHSASTVHTYGNFIEIFLDYINNRPLEKIDNDTVREFTEQVVEDRRYGISSHRQMVSALKHFADRFSAVGYDQLELKRPSKSSRLPTVLSQQEILDLLQVTANLKHRTILALMYSAGLRIGEVIRLELRDLDIDRRQIIVRQSKGRKDRHVMMAESLLPLILNYINSYRPEELVFAGGNGGHYSPGSIRAFLRRSCKLAGFLKRVTPHTLRHSFATHMIENGVNLRHVQDLLGHRKPETTMIYTHVAKKDLLRIRSPLDEAVTRQLSSDEKPLQLPFSQNFKG